MTRTAQQLTAIQSEGQTLLVNAGAGTGKTTVLVDRFLHLLEQHPDWPLDSIVAVTFTEKAANEMRRRLRRAIENRALHSAHWQARRLEVDRLQVSTIHALCARILRENAIAAALDPNFTVLDELDAALLREEAVAATLRRDDVTPALAGLLDYYTVATLSTELHTLLLKRGTVEPLLETLPAPDDLLARWAARRDDLCREVWEAECYLQNLTADVLEEIALTPISDPTDKLVPSVLAAQAAITHLYNQRWAEAVPLLKSINLKSGKAANWGDKETLAYLKAQLDTLREVGKTLLMLGLDAETLALDKQAATLLYQWRILWQALLATYDQIKDDRAALDFNDLERLTAHLLTQPHAPRLRAYLDTLNHVMVDEYQDTNRLQQQIIYTLAHPDSRRLFVVGDVKQSIYKFREADVTVFFDTRQRAHAVVELSQSFRSHQRLVAATNHLFEVVFKPRARTHAPYEAQPGPLSASNLPPHPAPFPSYTELWRLPAKNADGDKVSAQEARVREAVFIAERLRQLYTEQFPIRVREGSETITRPFRYGDAVILLRAMTDAPLYEEAFKAAGLPYLTVGGRGYFDRPEVEDLLYLLAALDNPADDLHIAAVLRSPFFTLSDETLFRLRWHDPAGQHQKTPRPLRDALREPPPTAEEEAVAHAGAVFGVLFDLRGRAEIWELLQLAVAETGYLATLALSDARLSGSRARRNAQKFLELARERGGANLSEFVRLIQSLKAREAREGEAIADPDAGVVQLMTIHAAKGLEFPVVLLADLGRTQRQGRGEILLAHPSYGIVPQWQDGTGAKLTPTSYKVAQYLERQMEEAENKRVLYVAATRAADLLILTGQDGTGEGSWLSQLVAAWQLPAPPLATPQIMEYEEFSVQVGDITI